MRIVKVLISHNVEEKDLAEAWKKLIETISSSAIEVWFSSDTEPIGGMTIGKEWREELSQKLKESDFVLAIQTPVSVGKPWIMWECGVASGIGNERGIIPITYEIKRGYLPNPLNVYQMYQGDDATQVQEVCKRLIHQAGIVPPNSIYTKAIKVYSSTVTLHRPRKLVRQEDTTLWVNRINELVQAGRIDELNRMRRQMYASIGTPPIQPDIHDRLSQLLMEQRSYEEALEETDYGLKLSPNDIPLLHRKALALVELHNLDGAKRIVERIIAQEKALALDTELAALLGRIYRERWLVSHNIADLNKAIDAYYTAYQSDPNSYYTGINAAELAFTKGDIAQGTGILQEVLSTCQQLQSKPTVSYWVDFTAGAVYLGLEQGDRAVAEYKKGLSRAPAPGPRERESAARGAARMASVRKLPTSVVDDIVEMLKAF